RDVEISTRDHLGHVAEEESQQQGADVRTINVSIRHDYHMMIPELCNIKFLPDAGAERGDEVADLLGGEDLVLAGLLDVEDLAAQREDRLEATVACALRRATGGIALDEVDLAQARVTFRAVGQLAGQRRRFEQRLTLHQLPSTLRCVAGASSDQALLDDSPRIRRILLEVLREGVG